MKLYITHAWMPYDDQHIAYNVMAMYANAARRSKLFDDVIMLSAGVDTDGQTPDVREDCVTVFSTGEPVDDVKTLMENAKVLVGVFEDPNWRVVFRPGRPYAMVTWFRALDGLSAHDAHAKMLGCSPLFEIDEPSAQTYMPLTSTVLEDEDQFNRYFIHGKRAAEGVQRTMASVCYAGSLKSDRGDAFKRLASEGCAFYGNFDREKFIDRIGECEFNALTSFEGHVDPFAVPWITAMYDEIAYMPDEPTVKLDTDTLRLAEIAMTGSKIRLVDNGCDPAVHAQARERLAEVLDDEGRATWDRFTATRDVHGFQERFDEFYGKLVAEC